MNKEINPKPLTEREVALMFIVKGSPEMDVELFEYNILDDGARECYVKFKGEEVYTDFSDTFTFAFNN